MKSMFYQRSVYPVLKTPIPSCFIDLDVGLVTSLPDSKVKFHKSIILAENLCRRMADIELYTHYISQGNKEKNVFDGSALIGTFLIGYFGSCKSLIDAGAITLTSLHNLNLSARNQDFLKHNLWKELDEKAEQSVSGRYTRFKPLFKDIQLWRDSAIHRLTPFVIVHAKNNPQEDSRDDMNIKMADQPDIVIDDVPKLGTKFNWVDTLHFPNLWHDQLLDFCQEICVDIKNNIT